jgi:hypothetical protein
LPEAAAVVLPPVTLVVFVPVTEVEVAAALLLVFVEEPAAVDCAVEEDAADPALGRH